MISKLFVGISLVNVCKAHARSARGRGINLARTAKRQQTIIRVRNGSEEDISRRSAISHAGGPEDEHQLRREDVWTLSIRGMAPNKQWPPPAPTTMENAACLEGLLHLLARLRLSAN